MILIIPPTPHGGALGSSKPHSRIVIALGSLIFSIFSLCWCLSKFHCISRHIFLRFRIDFGSIFDPFWLQYCFKIVVKSRLFFRLLSTLNFLRFSDDFARKLIWPTSFGSAFGLVFYGSKCMLALVTWASCYTQCLLQQVSKFCGFLSNCQLIF